MAVLRYVLPGAAMQLVKHSWMELVGIPDRQLRLSGLHRALRRCLLNEIPLSFLLPACFRQFLPECLPVALLPACVLAPAADLQRLRPIGREEAVVQVMVPWSSHPASGKLPLAVDAVLRSLVVPEQGSIYREPARPSPANLNFLPALRRRPGLAMLKHSNFDLKPA